VYLAKIAPANRRGAPAGLFQVDIVIGILPAHGGNFCAARFIAGAEARRYELAVSTLPATLLFTAYRHCSSCSLRRRLPRHRCAFNVRAVRIFREHDGAAIHRGIFLMPETRGVALERMNERLRMSDRKSSRRNM
jgi:hypothetical protein